MEDFLLRTKLYRRIFIRKPRPAELQIVYSPFFTYFSVHTYTHTQKQHCVNNVSPSAPAPADAQGPLLPSYPFVQAHSKGKSFRAGTARTRTGELVVVSGTTIRPLLFLHYVHQALTTPLSTTTNLTTLPPVTSPSWLPSGPEVQR